MAKTTFLHKVTIENNRLIIWLWCNKNTARLANKEDKEADWFVEKSYSLDTIENADKIQIESEKENSRNP